MSQHAEPSNEADALPNRLNLGAGEDYRPLYHNVDYNERYDPDAVVDLNDEWPDAWRGAFSHILASHIFEHLDDLHHAYAEAARCLEPGGTLEVRVPFGMNAGTDMTHQHHFDWDSGIQFAQNWQTYTPSYQFDPDPPLVLVEREVTAFHGHGPLGRKIASIVQRWWTGDSKWISDTPFCSGEFTFTYRKVPASEVEE